MPPMVFLMFLFSLSNTNPLAFEGWAIFLLFLMQDGLTLGSRGRRSGHSPHPRSPSQLAAPPGGPQGPPPGGPQAPV